MLIQYLNHPAEEPVPRQRYRPWSKSSEQCSWSFRVRPLFHECKGWGAFAAAFANEKVMIESEPFQTAQDDLS